MANIPLQELLKKYLDERLTPEEFAQLYELIHAGHDPEALNELRLEMLTNPVYAIRAKDFDKQEIFASLLAKIEEKESSGSLVEKRESSGSLIEEGGSADSLPGAVIPFYRSRWFRRTAAAAAVFAGLVIAAYFIAGNLQKRHST